MNEVALNDVGSIFKDLIERLRPGEEVGVLQDGERVATIRKEEHRDAASYPCKAGSAKGKILYMADDCTFESRPGSSSRDGSCAIPKQDATSKQRNVDTKCFIFDTVLFS